MFTDESTFRLVRGGIKRVRRPSGSNRFDKRFCVKTEVQWLNHGVGWV